MTARRGRPTLPVPTARDRPMSFTILIPGATAGFGAAMARRFVRDGHRVIATGRRAERL